MDAILFFIMEYIKNSLIILKIFYILLIKKIEIITD